MTSLAFGCASEFLFRMANWSVPFCRENGRAGAAQKLRARLAGCTRTRLSQEGVGEAWVSNECWPGSGRSCVPIRGARVQGFWASGEAGLLLGGSWSTSGSSSGVRCTCCVWVRNLVKCVAAQSSVTLPRPSEESVLGHIRTNRRLQTGRVREHERSGFPEMSLNDIRMTPCSFQRQRA